MRRPGKQKNLILLKDKISPEDTAQWKDKVHTINMYALPIIRYVADIVSWPTEDMKTVNVKTQKLFPPQVQLYFSWKENRQNPA